MSELIVYVLIIGYIYSGHSELIIAGGLFAIGAEINALTNKIMSRWEV